VPATSAHTIDPASPDDVTPGALWGLLPAGDRERFGLRLSRLVLRAVRAHGPEEDA
jgi:hypothetical protein